MLQYSNGERQRRCVGYSGRSWNQDGCIAGTPVITSYSIHYTKLYDIYGAELSAEARIGELWPAFEGWAARLSAAYTVGENSVNGEPLNSVDPASGVLAVAYEASSVV